LQMVSAPPLFAEAVALKSGATVDLPAHHIFICGFSE